jgi:hypothetical protein
MIETRRVREIELCHCLANASGYLMPVAIEAERNKKATSSRPVALGLVAVSPGYWNAIEIAVVSE